MKYKSIHKYKLKKGQNEWPLTLNYKVCHFNLDSKDSNFYMWVEETVEQVASMVNFLIVETAQKYNGETWEHVQTFMENSGRAWHLLKEKTQPPAALTYQIGEEVFCANKQTQ